MIHAVKCYPEYFEPLERGEKTFEVRRKDRPYAVGDFLAVNEFIPDDMWDIYTIVPREYRRADNGFYTGKCLIFRISYILDKPEFCVENMVILGLKKIEI